MEIVFNFSNFRCQPFLRSFDHRGHDGHEFIGFFFQWLRESWSIPHSSRKSSNQSADSSVSCTATPSLEMNSPSERAREASRTWAATEVPDRNNCLPNSPLKNVLFAA